MSVKKIVSLLLALALLCGMALADTVVGTSGSSWVRSGPGRGYEKLAVLSEGASCEYLGSTRSDERGVAWYNVRVDGVEGWVSSRYTALNADEGWGDEDFSWELGEARYVRATGARQRAFRPRHQLRGSGHAGARRMSDLPQ